MDNKVDEEQLYSRTNDEVSKLVDDLGKGLKAIFQSTNDSGEQTQDDNCTDKK